MKEEFSLSQVLMKKEEDLEVLIFCLYVFTMFNTNCLCTFFLLRVYVS